MHCTNIECNDAILQSPFQVPHTFKYVLHRIRQLTNFQLKRRNLPNKTSRYQIAPMRDDLDKSLRNQLLVCETGPTGKTMHKR